MTAAKLHFFNIRHETKRHYSKLSALVRHILVQLFGQIIENHADNIIIFKVLKTLYGRHCGKAHALAIHHKYNVCVGKLRKLIGAALFRKGQTIIKAHNTLNYGNIAAVSFQQIIHGIAVHKVAVKVICGSSYNSFMKHRINIIRTAFK